MSESADSKSSILKGIFVVGAGAGARKSRPGRELFHKAKAIAGMMALLVLSKQSWRSSVRDMGEDVRLPVTGSSLCTRAQYQCKIVTGLQDRIDQYADTAALEGGRRRFIS